MSTTSFKPLGKLLLLLSLPLYILDQITKWWVVFRFSEPQVQRYYDEVGQVEERLSFSTSDEAIKVIEGFFNITRVHNQGVAFGFGNGTSWAPVVFLIVPLVAVTILLIFWKNGGFATPMMKTSCALLFAGIAGNVTDRVLQGFWLERLKDASWWERFSGGYVVDFLDFRFPFVIPFTGSQHWPTFNVADSCISVAAILLIVSSFREETAQKQKN